MKRAIIALLTTIIGIFGYAVVDKTTDARLDALESQVSSQQDEIESLHGIGKYSETTEATTTKQPETTTKKADTTKSTEPTTEYSDTTKERYEINPYDYVGIKQKYVGKDAFTFYVYEDGCIFEDNEVNYHTDNRFIGHSNDVEPKSVAKVYITEAYRTLYSIITYGKADDLYGGYRLRYSYEVTGNADPELVGYIVKIGGKECKIDQSGNFHVKYNAEEEPNTDSLGLPMDYTYPRPLYSDFGDPTVEKFNLLYVYVSKTSA